MRLCPPLPLHSVMVVSVSVETPIAPTDALFFFVVFWASVAVKATIISTVLPYRGEAFLAKNLSCCFR